MKAGRETATKASGRQKQRKDKQLNKTDLEGLTTPGSRQIVIVTARTEEPIPDPDEVETATGDLHMEWLGK